MLCRKIHHRVQRLEHGKRCLLRKNTRKRRKGFYCGEEVSASQINLYKLILLQGRKPKFPAL